VPDPAGDRVTPAGRRPPDIAHARAVGLFALVVLGESVLAVVNGTLAAIKTSVARQMA
jgi:hypothetical protein